MTAREHVTDNNRHQAEATPRRRAEPSGHVSPAFRQWAEQVEQPARWPTTPAELDAMNCADRVRVHTTDRALYDRLTGRTPA